MGSTSRMATSGTVEGLMIGVSWISKIWSSSFNPLASTSISSSLFISKLTVGLVLVGVDPFEDLWNHLQMQEKYFDNISNR